MPSEQALYILALVVAIQVGAVFSVSCGQVTNTAGAAGYLTSPSKNHNGGFTNSYITQSGHYPASTDCTYTISAPSGSAIRLTWKTFDINGNMPDCASGDYVEIYIGCSRYSIGKYCSSNSQRPFDIYSPDSCLMLKFHSDSNNSTGQGFQAQFITFSASRKYRNYKCSTSKYGSLLTSSYGTISSSYWPANYPVTYSSCYFKISVSSGKKTKIVFMHFDLASDYGCDKTKVKIKGGGSSYSNSHRTIKDSMCGFKRPFSLTTGEDTIYIRFKTGSININDRGFIAGYVTYKPASGAMSGSTGVIVGIIIAIIFGVVIIAVIYCVVKKRRERQRRAAANQAVSVPLAAPASYPTQPPPQQSYAPPPSYGQAAAHYPPPGQEKPPPGSYPVQPDNQAAYPQQYYPPPGSQQYPPPGGQPYPPPGGQPAYPPPGGQPFPPPGGQPYPPPGGQPYPPPGGQPYPPPSGSAPPYPT